MLDANQVGGRYPSPSCSGLYKIGGIISTPGAAPPAHQPTAEPPGRTAVEGATKPVLSLLKNYGSGRGTGRRQVSRAVGAIATSVLAAARYACSLAWRNW